MDVCTLAFVQIYRVVGKDREDHWMMMIRSTNMSEPAVKPTSDNNGEPTTSQQDQQQQQQQQEQQPLPLSVFSILHDIQTTLSHRFPSPRTGSSSSSSSSAPYLHPYIRHSVQSADQGPGSGPGQEGQEYEPLSSSSSAGAHGVQVPWTEECARLRASLKGLRVGVGRFRDSWRGEKERVGAAAAGGGGGGQEVVGAGEVDEVVRQRKTVLLRIMIDWCVIIVLFSRLSFPFLILCVICSSCWNHV